MVAQIYSRIPGKRDHPWSRKYGGEAAREINSLAWISFKCFLLTEHFENGEIADALQWAWRPHCCGAKKRVKMGNTEGILCGRI